MVMVTHDEEQEFKALLTSVMSPIYREVFVPADSNRDRRALRVAIGNAISAHMAKNHLRQLRRIVADDDY